MNNNKKHSKFSLGLNLQNEIDADSLEKINAQADADKNGITTYRELFRHFRDNGLSRFESFYNALFLISLNRVSASSKVRTEYRSLFRHPKGWFRETEKFAAKSIWNIILAVLIFLPSFFSAVGSLPSRLAKKLTAAGEGFESSYRAGGFLKKILPTALTLLFAVGVLNYMIYDAGKTTALELYVDGERIGLVKSHEVFYSALDIAEDNLSNMLGLSYKIPGGTASYKVISTHDPVYLADTEISAALVKSSEKYLSIGYGLYIDDTLVAVGSGRMIMDKILAETLELYNTLYSATKEKDELISFANSVRINEITVPKSVIKTEEEIRIILGLDGLSHVSDLLLKDSSIDSSALDVSLMLPELEVISNKQISDNLPEETVYYIDSATTDSAVANDSLGTSSVLGSAGESTEDTTILSFKTTETKTVTEIMPCEVKYIYDNDVLEGRKIISVPGVDGIKRCTYDISYVGDKEVGRVLISEEVLKKPSTKTIRVGTRPASDFDSETSVTGTFILPCSGGTVTSTFAGRTLFGAYEFHGALDIASRHGTPIVASDGGEVVYAGWNGSYGNCIIIDHGDGLESLYAHLSAYAVEKGDKVGQGWKIGEMGATGRVTGVHVHFEIRVDGVRQDPYDYINQ